MAKKSNSNSTCSTGTVTKLYWRSIAGDALAETDGSGSTTNAAYSEYVFFGGRRIASRNGSGGIFYYFADQLGSTRTITTGSGTGQTPGQLCYDADFTPYGQEIQHTERLQTTACPPNYKFTGYERDTETGLDYAFARYYSARLGRFLSTDPLGGAIGDLQSHNAYTYTLNNPTNLVDPSGLRPGCDRGDAACTGEAADAVFARLVCGVFGCPGDVQCYVNGFASSCGIIFRMDPFDILTTPVVGPSQWVYLSATPTGVVDLATGETLAPARPPAAARQCERQRLRPSLRPHER